MVVGKGNFSTQKWSTTATSPSIAHAHALETWKPLCKTGLWNDAQQCLLYRMPSFCRPELYDELSMSMSRLSGASYH